MCWHLACWRDLCWSGLLLSATSRLEAYEAAHGNPFDWNLKNASEALLHKVCRASAGVKLGAVLKIDRLNACRCSP